MHFLLLTGRSGSGKSAALAELEDLGYCCIDNLPASMLDDFIAYKKRLKSDDINSQHAICIDSRTHDSNCFSSLVDTLQKHKEQGIDVSIVYLDASNKELIRRFSETRRKHPLTGKNLTLAEALEKEHDLLTPLRLIANQTIDTTGKSAYETRDAVRSILSITQGQMTIIVQSFGFKNGIPDGTDFIFDVRCLPNPYWIPELREKNGKTPETRAFLKQSDDTKAMIDDIASFILKWKTHFIENNRSYLTISIGCTGGFHRSVFVTSEVSRQLASHSPYLLERHRDKDKHSL